MCVRSGPVSTLRNRLVGLEEARLLTNLAIAVVIHQADPINLVKRPLLSLVLGVLVAFEAVMVVMVVVMVVVLVVVVIAVVTAVATVIVTVIVLFVELHIVIAVIFIALVVTFSPAGVVPVVVVVKLIFSVHVVRVVGSRCRKMVIYGKVRTGVLFKIIFHVLDPLALAERPESHTPALAAVPAEVVVATGSAGAVEVDLLKTGALRKSALADGMLVLAEGRVRIRVPDKNLLWLVDHGRRRGDEGIRMELVGLLATIIVEDQLLQLLKTREPRK